MTCINFLNTCSFGFSDQRLSYRLRYTYYIFSNLVVD